ncbi:NAD(P)/FAD-dependent oxidoreductase [Streptomyces sp. NPDC048514]|uniref:NAD(P)/FAD-dependent oxidoreductase n=1 Tax=Streptomyces sp. NPDC048514 TaxID=3365564 RepID=UPI003722ABFA
MPVALATLAAVTLLALRLFDWSPESLLEAEFCGYGASSRNGGQIASVPGGDLRLLSPFHPKKVPGMVRVAENSARFTEDLIKTHGIDCDHEPNGLAFAAVSHGQMLRTRTIAAILRRAGGRGTVGTSEELGIPRSFVGGMREAVGGALHPGRLSRGVRRALLASSAQVYERTKVTDVTRDGGKVVLSTPRGTVRADKAAPRPACCTDALISRLGAGDRYPLGWRERPCDRPVHRAPGFGRSRCSLSFSPTVVAGESDATSHRNSEETTRSRPGKPPCRRLIGGQANRSSR